MKAIFVTDEEASFLAQLLSQTWTTQPGGSRWSRHSIVKNGDTPHATVSNVIRRVRKDKYPEEKERQMAISRERAKAIKRAKAALGVDE